MVFSNTSGATRSKIMLPRRRMDRRRRTRARRHLQAPRRRLYCNVSHGTKKRSSSKAVARKMEALRELIPPSAVARKMEALRELIPPSAGCAGEKKLWKATEAASTAPERLFGETAEYILALRAQVEILKRLVDFYSAPIHLGNGNAA